jgi:hypothetical protein
VFKLWYEVYLLKNVDLLALSRAARSELLMQERHAWLERVRAEFDAEYAYV